MQTRRCGIFGLSWWQWHGPCLSQCLSSSCFSSCLWKWKEILLCLSLSREFTNNDKYAYQHTYFDSLLYRSPPFLYSDLCEIENIIVKLSFIDNGCYSVIMVWYFLIVGFYFYFLSFLCFGNWDMKVLWFLQGWTYGFNGALLKATRISGMRNFNVNVCRYVLW